MANGFGFDVTKKSPALLQPVQIQPARVQFPTPRPTTRRREKDPDKQLVQYGAGLLAPVLGELLTRGLGAIPGIDKFIYEDPAETRKEFGLPSLVDPVDPKSVLTDEVKEGLRALAENPQTAQFLRKDRQGRPAIGISDPRQMELARRRGLVRQAFGDPGDMPRRKTFLGEMTSQIGGVLPGLALDDDGDISTFVGASQAANKIASGIEAAKLDNYLKLERKRAESLLAVGDLKDYIGYSNFMRQGDSTDTQVTRQIKASKDGTVQYILSRGDKEIDAVTGPDGTRYAVPKGQYYVDPNFLFTEEKADKPVNHMFLVNSDDITDVSEGYTQYEVKEGRYVPVLYVRDKGDEGKYKRADDWAAGRVRDNQNVIWVKPPSNFYELQKTAPKQFPELVDLWKERSTSQRTLLASVKPLMVLAQGALRADGINPDTGEPLLDRTGRPMKDVDLLTTVGALKPFIAELTREAQSALRFVSDTLATEDNTSPRNVFTNYYESQADQNNYFLKFYDAQNSFINAIDRNLGQAEIDKQRTRYYAAMKQYRDNVADQGGRTDFLDNLLNFGDESYDDFLQVGADRAKIAAAQTQLAYTIAAQDGNTGTALSDRDVSNYLMRAGFGSKNPKELLDKAELLMVTLLEDFDGNTTLANLSGAALFPDDISSKTLADRHLRGYGISQRDLDFITDLNNPEKERVAKAESILDEMGRKTQTLAGQHFDYNRKTGRIELRTVDRIMQQSMRKYYDFFNNVFLPYQGTSVDNIVRQIAQAAASGQGQRINPQPTEDKDSRTQTSPF